MSSNNQINNTVTFREFFRVADGVPEGVGIMAPEWVIKKARRGEPLTEDDMRFCCKIDWRNND